MPPALSHVVSELRQVVFYHLDNGLFENALFAAGRLHAIDPKGMDSVHLLALCYSRSGSIKTAYDYSRAIALKNAHLGCSYIFAQCCLSLQIYSEGIQALERTRHLWLTRSHFQQHSETSRRHLPDAAAVFCLLGKLNHAAKDIKRAAEHYVEALELNPFMWDAYERLCETGTKIRPSHIFRINPELMATLPLSRIDHLDQSAAPVSTSTQAKTNNASHLRADVPDHDPFKSTRPVPDHIFHEAGSNLLSKMNMTKISVDESDAEDLVLPNSAELPIIFDVGSQQLKSKNVASIRDSEALSAPIRKSRLHTASTGELRMDASRSRPTNQRLQRATTEEGTISAPQTKRILSASFSSASVAPSAGEIQPTRRSNRIFSQIRPNNNTKASIAPINSLSKDTAELRKMRAPIKPRPRSVASTSTVGRVVSGNRKPPDPSMELTKESRPDVSVAIQRQQEKQQEKKSRHDALHTILNIFDRLGRGHYALCQYDCPAALEYFQGLPSAQKETPWVLAQIAKAQYEQSNYREAEKTFAKIRSLLPSGVKDMELYSTVLWHLKNDTELAFLAHELVEANRLSPQPWCTIGNSFSLQRDHDQALKCFRRATQLAPDFAYGYTLQGHEHIANEEYDKALLAYRKAITADNRHYNGWYGVAKVYEKLGKYELAERHYRMAAHINPTNPILTCCIGMVLEKLKKLDQALEQYKHAIDSAPDSAIARFKKARLLLHMHRHQEALQDFIVLKDMAPDESNVHFMLARVYKILKQKGAAIKHFTIAMNLDPKASQYIREAMESLDDDENDDDEDEVMS